MFGMVGDFGDSKARWAVKTGRGKIIWVKSANLLPAGGMSAKVMLMKRSCSSGTIRLRAEALEQRLQQVGEEVKNRGADSQITSTV